MERAALTISLYVPSVETAVAFYTDTLGFHETGRWVEDDKPLWAEVSRDGSKGTARVWFFCDAIKAGDRPTLTGMVYLFVDDVDVIAAELEGKAKVRWGPDDMPYGLRELGVEDPHGYLIVFAKDI